MKHGGGNSRAHGALKEITKTPQSVLAIGVGIRASNLAGTAKIEEEIVGKLATNRTSTTPAVSSLGTGEGRRRSTVIPVVNAATTVHQTIASPNTVRDEVMKAQISDTTRGAMAGAAKATVKLLILDNRTGVAVRA